MSATDPTCTCTHAAGDHSNIPGVGCVLCSCELTRRRVQLAADELATAQALHAVATNADPAWVALATAAVHELARRQVPFTPDDVWEYLADQDVAQPSEPRALGPIMKAELRSGRIKLEGYATSRRRHSAIIRSYTGA